MYTLHIGNKNYSSWSLRPWILLTELGIPFQEHLHVFGPDFTAKSEGGSPSGKVPCLRDGERAVWDSLAIVEYVAEKRPGVWPADAGARAWARSAAAEMHSSFGALRDICSMSCGVRIKLNSIPGNLLGDLDRLAELWMDGLKRFGGPFLAGPSFGGVDAFFCPVAFRVQTYGLKLPQPCMEYVDRLLALDGMKRWYDAALKEPWRDLPHEVELKRFGTTTSDLRIPVKAAATA
ncbi:MAG TPA: glutathione S-transferase family protein [Usitatibacter sp.]|nr:glutathione S-transferase family protein [Usitatibacter sp.]